MQLLINDCPVDIRHAGGDRVADLVDSVAEWSRERNLVLYELCVDDGRYSADMAPDLSLNDVSVINCIVQSKADIVFSSAEEGARYCERAAQFVRTIAASGAPRDEDMHNLISGISWLGEVMARVLGLLGLDAASVKHRDRTVEDHLGDLESFRASCEAAAPENIPGLLAAAGALFEETRGIFRMLLLGDAMRALIVQSIDSPDVLLASMAQVREDLPAQIENVREAAAAYQSGKDAAASERLKGFVDFVYRYTRTCGQVAPVFRVDMNNISIDGVSMDEKNRELRALLHELTSVMEHNDIISLSDVLEYEITPVLSNLGSYIDALREAIAKA